MARDARRALKNKSPTRIEPLINRIVNLLARLADTDPGLTVKQIKARLESASNAPVVLKNNPDLFEPDIPLDFVTRNQYPQRRWRLKKS